MRSRVYRRIWGVVEGFERSGTDGRKGGGKPASPLRADARQAPCGLRSVLEARQHEGIARSAPRTTLSCPVCLRSATHCNSFDWWEQNGQGPFVQGVCADGRFAVRRTSGNTPKGGTAQWLRIFENL